MVLEGSFERVAFISDLHGNLPALRAVLRELHVRGADRGVDRIVCLGDLVGYGPWPNEVAALIQDREILTIQGNFDRAVALDEPLIGVQFPDADTEKLAGRVLEWTKGKVHREVKRWLAGLPIILDFKMDNLRAMAFHGGPLEVIAGFEEHGRFGRDILAIVAASDYLRDESAVETMERMADRFEADLYVFGHTHKPLLVEVEGRCFVNVGSAGKPHDGAAGASYAVVDLRDGSPAVEFRCASYDLAELLDGLARSDLPKGLPDRLREKYENAVP